MIIQLIYSLYFCNVKECQKATNFMKNSPQIVFCTVASNDYLHYLERFLVSANKYVPEALIDIVLVNVAQEKDDYLRILHSNIEIIHDYVYFNNVNEQGGYCTNRRASILHFSAIKYPDSPIAWLDVDSLFVAKADNFINHAKKYDLSVLSRPHSLSKKKSITKKKTVGPLGTPYMGAFSAGIITSNNSKIAKEFLDRYKQIVRKSPLTWYTDQEGLFLVYLDYKSRLNFCDLPEKFNCRYLKDDTIILVPKKSYRDQSEFWLMGEKLLASHLNWPLKRIRTNVNNTNIENISTGNCYLHSKMRK